MGFGVISPFAMENILFSSMIYLWKIVIFHSYAKSPEGIFCARIDAKSMWREWEIIATLQYIVWIP